MLQEAKLHLPIQISKNILKTMGRTNGKYNLIKEGDKVAVGLSGGKDSLTLIHSLKQMQKKAPFDFEIKAITISYGMGENFDYLSNHCKKYDIEHEIIKTNIFDIAQEKIRDNSSFCSFFSRMRRGSLYTTALEQGYNKLALAHHLDDAIESFFMNMFYNGALRTMPPIYKSDRGIVVIRPFIFLRERQFRATIEKNNIQAIGDEACPAMKINVKMPYAREKIKAFVEDLEKDNKDIVNTIKASFSHLNAQSFFDTTFYDEIT